MGQKLYLQPVQYDFGVSVSAKNWRVSNLVLLQLLRFFSKHGGYVCLPFKPASFQELFYILLDGLDFLENGTRGSFASLEPHYNLLVCAS